MARYAIGDLQGCRAELAELLKKIRFSADRDQLWFTGDIVNRGPDSLGALQLVHSLDANATLVLGNHDLHLLAVYFCKQHNLKRGDTLSALLAHKQCSQLLQWLLERPLVHHDTERDELLVHAGLVPQWSAERADELARATRVHLLRDPATFLGKMYGNEPDRWDESLTASERDRFVVNALTRLRICTADGLVDLDFKGTPDAAPADYAPWYAHRNRASAATRVVFGHWSTLGLMQQRNLLALDTGCVWGGALTAVDLDDDERPPIQVPCVGYQLPGAGKSSAGS
ncbi:MAG: symmetrical bis(5'-nucleosyl)-tetraphosphatase [Pseudomonadales bacterium]|jgi:bis(5'-nucleosyl)-tetraphosphatase (symmetrical)|nr:symmetrical bis(5'-nucleosyl)-tetraphosphatase [Pseudomonadales bacterium]